MFALAPITLFPASGDNFVGQDSTPSRPNDLEQYLPCWANYDAHWRIQESFFFLGGGAFWKGNQARVSPKLITLRI